MTESANAAARRLSAPHWTWSRADLTALPFRDKQFDYVVLSHVIEHIPAEDLDRAVRELIRVAHAGYIEAPSSCSRRFVRYRNTTGMSSARATRIHGAQGGSAATDCRIPGAAVQRASLHNRRSEARDLFTGLEWHGTFRVEIASRRWTRWWTDTLRREVLAAVERRRAGEEASSARSDPRPRECEDPQPHSARAAFRGPCWSRDVLTSAPKRQSRPERRHGVSCAFVPHVTSPLMSRSLAGS